MNLFEYLNIGTIIPLSIVFLFLIRELVTWYWKVNKAINLLERIEENTRKEKVK